MQDQRPSSELMLVPMEPTNAIQEAPQSRKKKQKGKLTRIERYNVAELCWKLYLNLSREPQDIAVLLNKHLASKRDAFLRAGKIDEEFNFPQLTRMDVRVFLETQQKRIDNYLGNERKRMMESSFDVIKKIQSLAIDTEETMGVWKARLEDALNRGDDRALVRATTMLNKERDQIHRMIKDLAQLLGKVKTYISIDMMHAQVMSIADIIDQDDAINDDAKIHLIQQISRTLDVAAIRVV